MSSIVSNYAAILNCTYLPDICRIDNLVGPNDVLDLITQPNHTVEYIYFPTHNPLLPYFPTKPYFPNTPLLLTIILSNNRITSVDSKLFLGLFTGSNSKTVNFSFNLISYLPAFDLINLAM